MWLRCTRLELHHSQSTNERLQQVGAMGRRRKIPTEPVDIDIESLSHDGRGVGRIEGKAVFVDGALPGERVRLQYTSRRRKFDEGKTLEVLTASADRVAAKCPHFAACGGCSLQHLSTEAQIKAKESILLENLTRIGSVEPTTLLPALQKTTWAYRTKARLGLRYVPKKGKVLIGFREKRSSFITDAERCDILHSSVGERFTELAGLVESLSIKQFVPQIEVAVGDAQTCLIFRVLEPLSDSDTASLRAFGEQHQLCIQVQPGGPDSIYSLGEAPDLYYRLEPQGIRVTFQSQDFTQVNPDLNQAMIQQALALMALDKQDKVLDLFCGLGNFSMPLAQHAGEVIGVEGEQAMVQRATQNAQDNGIDNIRFYAADLFEPQQDAAWMQQHYTKVLLDPPRSGAEEIIHGLKHLKPQLILYVSCNPATLARDAGILVNQYGYELQKAGAMDMFPHTAHVEAMALFVLR